MEHEVLEQGKLLRGQGDFSALVKDAVVDPLKFEISVTQDCLGTLSASAQQRAAASRKLEETKGLQQAVVGAGVQALNAGLQVAWACKDQNGCI